jgi:hypothetical protein
MERTFENEINQFSQPRLILCRFVVQWNACKCDILHETNCKIRIYEGITFVGRILIVDYDGRGALGKFVKRDFRISTVAVSLWKY